MKILFFSPHAYFSVHALPEAVVAEALALAGHDIHMISCDGLYRRHCLTMSNVGYADQAKKRRICAVCKTNRNAIGAEFRFPTTGIEAYLTAAEAGQAAAAAAALDPANFLQFEWDGIPVASYALYEFWLNHKLSSEEIDTALWPEYLAIFENTLKTLFASRRMMDDLKPARIVCYNSLYSVNRVMAAVAEQKAIPHFTLHAGRHHKHRLQQMTIYKGIGYGVTVNRLPALAAYRAQPCTAAQVDIVTEHVRELFRATSPWVYSIRSGKRASAELLDRYAVGEGCKVLLAVMRSNDERLAARFAGVGHYDGTPLFADQYQWLSWLAGFARNHPEYVIIFRVHPREFPNKREGVTSQNAYAFMNFIETLELPANLHINLPRDNLSLHDLLKISDVLLNNTSTAGLEASLFGIPVVGIRDDLYAFDLALQEEPDSIDDYVARIAAACASGWRFSRVVGVYRWLNYLNTETAIDIADAYDPARQAATRRGRMMQLLRRKLRSALGLAGGFDEIRGRARPPAGADKLVYAIVNNRDSHIGAFPMGPAGDPAVERQGIRQAYGAFMESISNPEDAQFRSRIEACLAND
ncbi:hypothetical protein [Oryzomicrobium sp.]|uniref:hypothetical protein n=1 Tax=Oryzomicrobium sp. TaxID=1911578 RepID=UPI002FE1C49B